MRNMFHKKIDIYVNRRIYMKESVDKTMQIQNFIFISYDQMILYTKKNYIIRLNCA